MVKIEDQSELNFAIAYERRLLKHFKNGLKEAQTQVAKYRSCIAYSKQQITKMEKQKSKRRKNKK